MVLSVADIDRWDPDAVFDVFRGARERAAVVTEASDGLGQLPAFSDWGGIAAQAAKDAVGKTRVDLDSHGEEATAVAEAAKRAADDVQKVKDDLTHLRADAASLDMQIDPVTDTVVPGPGFSGNPMELLLKQQQLQPRLAAILADANGVDAELAQAINMADGRMPIPTVSGQAPIHKLSGGDHDTPAESTGPSVLANLNRANDQAVLDAMQRVKDAQAAVDRAASEAYVHGPGSPEAAVAMAQLPQLKKNLADALDSLGKIPDYSKIDPNAVNLVPNGSVLFSYLADGQVQQVTGTLKNGTGEIFDQGTKAYYTYQNGKLVGPRFLDEGRAIATDEPLLTAVTTAVGAGPLVKGGEAGWVGLRALFSREGVGALTGVTGDNVLTHATDLAATRTSSALADMAANGPGAWGPSHEGFTGLARTYQEFITSHPIANAYIVEGPTGPVKFDNFANGMLIDAKADYQQFVDKGAWDTWFQGDQKFLADAFRQTQAAGGTPIQWVFLQQPMAQRIARLLEENGITNINVVWKPMN